MSYTPPPDPQQPPGQPGVPPSYDPNAAPPQQGYGAPPPAYGYPPPPQQQPDYGQQPPQQGYGYPPQGYGYGYGQQQQPPPQWQAPNPNGPVTRGQSLCGAVAIGMGVLGILLVGVAVLMAMPTAMANPGQMPDTTDPTFQKLGMFSNAGFCLQFLGLVVASFGFLEKDKGRVTIWVAYVVNGLPCLCMCGFGALGLVMLGGMP